jgi:hypothetical protein
MCENSLRTRVKYLVSTNPSKISVNIYTKISIYGFFLLLLFF